MAIKNAKANASASTEAKQTTWVKIAIPDAKLKLIWTDKEKGTTSMGFEVADASGCKAIFYASVKNVRRNNDATGFIVSMPEKPINLSERIDGADGKATYNKFTADCVADLGYPVVQ